MLANACVFGDVLIVDTGGLGTHTSIQEAIDSASDGDDIIVNPGVYLERIDFLGKQITVQSTNPFSPAVVAQTVIDGQKLGHVVTFASAETAESILEGLTIQNGLDADGGGIYCINGSDPTIRFNRIANNACDLHGGGIYCNASSPTILANEIVDNICEGRGGGIYAVFSDAIIEANSIINNNAGCSTGGGVYLGMGSDGTAVSNNSIVQNRAINGGGLELEDSSGTVARNHILGNVSAQRGGGISCINASPVIRANIIAGNMAIFGAAVDCNNSAAAFLGNTFVGNLVEQAAVVLAINFSNLEMTGNIIAFHSAGTALQAVSGATISADNNCLFSNLAGNSSGSVTMGPANIFQDPLLALAGAWEAGAPDAGAICGGIPLVATLSGAGLPAGDADYGAGVISRRFRVDVVDYPPGPHDVEINTVVVAQIVVDLDGNGSLVFNTEDGTMPPGFPDVVAGDLVDVGGLASGTMVWGDIVPVTDFWMPGDEHLMPGSPCIDAGGPGVAGLGAGDIDGQPRAWGLAPDIGADEVVPDGTGDADADGDIDLLDLATVQHCFGTLLGGLPEPECALVDLDGNLEINNADWSSMSMVVTGPLP